MSTVFQTHSGPVVLMESALASRMANLRIEETDRAVWRSTASKSSKSTKSSRHKSNEKRNSDEPLRSEESGVGNPDSVSRVSHRKENRVSKRDRKSETTESRTETGERTRTSQEKVKPGDVGESVRRRTSDRSRASKEGTIVVAEDEEGRTRDNRSKKSHGHGDPAKGSNNGKDDKKHGRLPSGENDERTRQSRKSSRTQSTVEIDDDKHRHQTSDARKSAVSHKHSTKQTQVSENVSGKDNKKSSSEKRSREKNTSERDASKKSNDAKVIEDSVATMKGGPRKKGEIDGQESGNVDDRPPLGDETRSKLKSTLINKLKTTQKKKVKLPDGIKTQPSLALTICSNDYPSTSGASVCSFASPRSAASSEQRDNVGSFSGSLETGRPSYRDLLDDNKEDKVRYVYNIAQELLMEREGHVCTNGQDSSSENVNSVGPMSSGSSLPCTSPKSDAIYSPEDYTPCSSRDLAMVGMSHSVLSQASEPCLDPVSDIATFAPHAQGDIGPTYASAAFHDIPSTTVSQVSMPQVGHPNDAWSVPISGPYLSSSTGNGASQPQVFNSSRAPGYLQDIMMEDSGHSEYSFEQTPVPQMIISPEHIPSHISAHGSDQSPSIFTASPASEDAFIGQGVLGDGMSPSLTFRDILMDEDS